MKIYDDRNGHTDLVFQLFLFRTWPHPKNY